MTQFRSFKLMVNDVMKCVQHDVLFSVRKKRNFNLGSQRIQSKSLNAEKND